MVKLADIWTLLDHAVYKLLSQDPSIKTLHMFKFEEVCGPEWGPIYTDDPFYSEYLEDFELEIVLSLKYGINIYVPKALKDNNY